MAQSVPEVDDVPLVVAPEEVARRLGISSPNDATLAKLADAIRDAQYDVEAYLGRPITPRQVTETGRWPNLWGGWSISTDEDMTVVSATPEVDGNNVPTGLYTVVYTVGLDAATDSALGPIRRYVTAAAMNSPQVLTVWQQLTNAQGTITNVSAEGQSISYSAASLGGGGLAGSGAPGALPDIASLVAWKRRAVYQRRSSTLPWW